MKCPQGKIYKVVSESDSRPTLKQVYFDDEKKALVAADGFMMAVVPVDASDNDVGGLVDPDVLKLARKRGSGELVLDEKYITISGTGWRVDRGQDDYPDCKAVLEQCKTNADKAAPVLVLSAERLYKLAQAICDTSWLGVKIFLPRTSTGAIEVRPEVETGARGILMPMAHRANAGVDLTPLVKALENDEEITPEMRAQLKSLLGLR